MAAEKFSTYGCHVVRLAHFLCLGSLALLSAGRATAPAAPASTSEVYAHANDGTPLSWNVYPPSGPGPWPAVLVIHGGMFVGGDPGDAGAEQCAQDLSAAGYLAFSIAYRLAPPGSLPGQRSLGHFPDQTDDVRLAVLAARNDARGNGQVGAIGGSAGASHAAWVAVTGQPGVDRLDVAVCISGAYDFTDFRPDDQLQNFIEAVTNYVGVAAEDTASLRAASPAWAVDSTVAPLSLYDSVGDLMPAVQLDDLVARLVAVGAKNYEARSIGGDGHSFENWTAIQRSAIAFLAKNFEAPRVDSEPDPDGHADPDAHHQPDAQPDPIRHSHPDPVSQPGRDG